ncbi:hypothetical protein [Streptacidiphilus melanogenes]|uniref:hypothetical protein n=1 Tax=Streptacidiphilus melanogenes TaxID=411235 RepID=UPI0005A7FDA8|nr:hypothetical protein [Streptacidiphilus melanogenes]
MELLLLRSALAPLLVLLASVLARRLGPRRGGQLLGAPTTSGPFLALTWIASGPEKAAAAAHGTATGMLGVACFCLAYARLAPTRRPARTLAIALACAAGAALAGAGGGSVWLSTALAVSVIVVGLLTWPSVTPTPARPNRGAGGWEIPARMAITGVVVAGALAASDVLGSFVAGVLTALPVLLSVMVTSTHREAGGRAAVDMLRGALTSTAGTLGFMLVLCFAPTHLGPVAAFGLALAALVLGERLLRRCAPRAAATGRTA